MAEPASGGGFGFKAETLLAVPGTLAWHVAYFFLITIVVGEGALRVSGAALQRGGSGRWWEWYANAVTSPE